MILCQLHTEAFTILSPLTIRTVVRIPPERTIRHPHHSSGDDDDYGGDGTNSKRNQKNNDDDTDNNNSSNKKDDYSLSDAEMKWMESRSTPSSSPNENSAGSPQQTLNDYDDDNDGNEGAGNVNIPKTGISVSDEMVALQSKENFVTRLISLAEEDGYGGSTCVPAGVRAAKIETTVSDQIGEEPARYLVPLSASVRTEDEDEDDSTNAVDTPMKYAMVDVPPFSEELANQIRTFMSSSSSSTSSSKNDETQTQTGILSNILITCRDGIHYDESPAVYVTRKSDLISWKRAFPEAHIVIYRLDAPRECKELVNQVLDGYGPWAFGEAKEEAAANNDTDDSPKPKPKTKTKKKKQTTTRKGDDGTRSLQFVETGRPLTRVEWSEEVQEQVLDQGMAPPDDDDDGNDDVNGLYTPEAIRAREEGKEILALYTPGHTFGSVTYLFPHVKICCSGYTIPLEDARTDGASGSMAGPTMDYRGYITTNQGGMARQIESAQHLIDVYGDRFEAVLPSRGSPVCLPGDRNGNGTDTQRNVKYRARIWGQVLNDYAELGKVYEQLGII
eukprot:CAMPEP_0198259634 /NCGR_PEP_ID=MMETSP1447-20131203/8771_1 /TAXON_ID=420782 /ORGANISM="Chaetoceros dichaeta, Strain CCMP1751" /LENGTH=558 /DNA_ID=CAMNT_0043947069 /DNA_START=1 /DNA_END=1677 /DNA_ORIENTATION=+